MNIAIFASAFYPHFGGVEELVRQLALAYKAQGDTVIIITNRWPRDLPEYEEYDGLPVYRITMRTPEGALKRRLTYQFTHTGIERGVVDILRKNAIDVLHVQCVSCNGYYALVGKRALNLPLVVTAQGELTMDADRIFEKSDWLNQLLRELAQEAAIFTGCSGKTLGDVERHLEMKFGSRGRVIFNGANIHDFDGSPSYAHPRPYILGIGRCVPQKGFDVLIKAFAEAKIESHDLLIAGDGSEKATLEALASDLKLNGKVHFVGRADRPMALSLFKGCSFFALPSRTDEGLPLVSVEAMAAGKALAGTTVGGIPESVADGVSGLLVAPEDVSGLASVLRRLADDRELRERMGAASYARAQRFDWPVLAEEYRAAYREAIRAAKGEPALAGGGG